jgi:hypothetical protein
MLQAANTFDRMWEERINGRLVVSVLLVCAVVAIVCVHLLGGGHSLAEETYNIDSVTVNTSIQSCSQEGGAITIRGVTSTNRVGLVQVTLYALTGPKKYATQRIVTLGMMSPTQGDRDWTSSVTTSGPNAWGCGVKTTIGPPPPL